MSYHDSEGNEISLYKLVRLEPDWAVSIIPHLKKELQEYEELNESFDFRHKVDTESLFSLEEELQAKDEELKSRVAAYRLSVKSREGLRRELEAKNKVIDELKEGMAQIVKAVEDCNWGWDGDCGISGKIDFIIDELTNKG